MARCDVCGNDYAKSMVITMADRKGTFDSFECALHAMAPACEHCGCRIIGHGVEAPGDRYFCCANCATLAGIPEQRINA
jgi:hypothetical protein